MRNYFKSQMVTIELFGKSKVNKAKERWRRKLERKKKRKSLRGLSSRRLRRPKGLEAPGLMMMRTLTMLRRKRGSEFIILLRIIIL